MWKDAKIIKLENLELLWLFLDKSMFLVSFNSNVIMNEIN
jgi:hypothetical protein